MSTVLRAKLSQRNPYWIDRHRYYELKHFCLQYPTWKRAYRALDGYSRESAGMSDEPGQSGPGDPTFRYVDAREGFLTKIEMVEKAARETDLPLSSYILKGVTEGLAFDKLRAQTGMPCGKDFYYELYRRFFWLLSKARN